MNTVGEPTLQSWDGITFSKALVKQLDRKAQSDIYTDVNQHVYYL